MGLFGFLAAIFILSAASAIYTDQYLLLVIPFSVLFFYFGWLNRNTVFYLLLICLPFSFEFSFSESLGTDVPDEMLMLLVSFVFFAYWVYHYKSIVRELKFNPLLFLLSAWVIWMLITVLFSTEPILSVKYLLSKFWYIGAFVLAPLIIFHDKKAIKKAAILFSGSLLIITLIIVTKHKQDGFSFSSVNDAAFPFFRNHVNYSAMLVCLFPILVCFYRLSEKRSRKIFVSGLIVFVLIALFLSYARGAWLALLIGIVSYFLLKFKILFQAYLIAILASVVILFWLKSGDRYLKYAHDYKTTIFHNDFNEHIVATYKLKDVSTAERFYRWIAGVRMIKDKPVFGYGPNTFYNNYRSYAIPAYKTWVSDNVDRSTVHNYYLLLAIEQGMPGLLFFLILTATALLYAQRLYHRIRDEFYRTTVQATGIILVMILVLNFLSDLIETDKIGSLFFLCLSVLVVIDHKTREKVTGDE